MQVLVCHPASPTSAVRTIVVQVERAADGGLVLRYRIDADLERVRVPAPRPAAIAGELWRHTCCEAFVAVDGRPGYHEFNFSPSSEWMAHGFRAYRAGGPLSDEALAPAITVARGPGALTLAACIPLARLSAEHVRAPLRLGLAAVVEASDGTLSYWALHHPLARPDFHHGEAFALRLEPPAAEC
jgi:hypothetical protein